MSQITPHYAWAEPALPVEPPTVLDLAGSMHRTSFAMTLVDGGDYELTLNLRSRVADGIVKPYTTETAPFQPMLLDSVGSPFSGTRSNTGLSGQFGAAEMGMSVVLVHQRFAAPALDGIDLGIGTPRSGIQTLEEISHGTGLEVHASHPVVPGLHWYAGYRSRINMDAFQNYRGVYGRPGDIDIPAEARFGFEWAPTVDTQVKFGVDRVMYSSVQPFVSAALPRRLLALLGDGTSPEFSWRDLDIYSVTLMHDVSPRSRWSIRYSTREQPLPTSELLANALLQEAADYGIGVSYIRDAGPGQWRLVANYAPAQYMLGASTRAYGNTSANDSQIEFEALWTMPF